MTRRLIALFVVAVAMSPLAAGAQNPQPAPPGVQSAPMAPPSSPSPPPEKVAPGGLDTRADNKTMSEKLAQQHGTLQPPSVDPRMTVTPPAQQGTMAVIPPPGSPGGDERVVPK